jgi:hypothetical protein
MDHQAELQREIRLGVRLWDGIRTIDLWFMVSVRPAQAAQEYDEQIMAQIKEKFQDISPDRAWRRFNSVPQDYQIVVKTLNDTVEMWYIPQT